MSQDDFVVQSMGDVCVTVKKGGEPTIIYDESKLPYIAAISMNFLNCDLPAVRIPFETSPIRGFKKLDIVRKIKNELKKVQNGKEICIKTESKRNGNYVSVISFK